MEEAVVISAIATAIIALLTLWNVLITKRLVDFQLDPCIVFGVEQLESGSGIFCLVMRNVGGSPAFNVRPRIISKNYSVEIEGVLKDIQKYLDNEWPMIRAGQAVSWVLDDKKLSKDRNTANGILLEAAFAKTPTAKSNCTTTSDISPSWTNGELLCNPGIERELRSRFDQITKSINGLAGEIRSLTKSQKESAK